MRLKRKAFTASVSLFFFSLAIDVGKTSVQLIFEMKYGKRQSVQSTNCCVAQQVNFILIMTHHEFVRKLSGATCRRG